ncbi:MAG: carboxypeptidase-like regulatory domain-containing protein [Candidatus Electryonea clarkiae]|nr:carboxypeptidase-like regulatory domain-containing protein [Candidatus Electryonea clarkiae]
MLKNKLTGISFGLILIILVLFFIPDFAYSAVIQGKVMLKKSGELAPHVSVFMNGRPGKEGNADGSGQFEFTNITRGIYTVGSKPYGYYPAGSRYSVSEKDTIHVELFLIPKSSSKLKNSSKPALTVIVIGGGEAKPVAGANVIMKGPLTRSQLTDKVGRVIFRNLKPGLYKLSATHSRHGKVEDEIQISPGGIMMEKILRFDSK